ncbi:MAG: YciC family protein [Spirochaetota bacterium]
MNELSVGAIVGNGVKQGVSSAGAIIVNVVLYVLTVWIPYLNVGTTIGLTVGLVAKAGRGEPISPTEIFNPVYRKQMGDYFLVSALVSMGTSLAILLLVIPGIVLSIAWSLATLLVVDKGLNPTAAMTKSNNVTYGKKWTIFFGVLVLTLIVAVVAGVLAAIGAAVSETLGAVLAVIGVILSVSILICGNGYIYNTLTSDVVAEG